MTAITKISISALLAGGVFVAGCSNPASFDPQGGTDPLPTEFAAPDFSTVPDGTLLEDLGYEVENNDNSGNPLAVPGFVVNGGVIESDSDDLAGWFSFSTPEFQIDRDENGGVMVEWEIRYPETIPSGDHERAKYYLRLTDADGSSLYRFLFKPYLGAAQSAFNLELARDDPETSLQQVRSRDVDPAYTLTGAAAPWINFKLKLEATGEITLLIDDVVFMSGVTDSTHSVFSRVEFTYRTTDAAKNYTIQIRNLSVLPLN